MLVKPDLSQDNYSKRAYELYREIEPEIMDEIANEDFHKLLRRIYKDGVIDGLKLANELICDD